MTGLERLERKCRSDVVQGFCLKDQAPKCGTGVTSHQDEGRVERRCDGFLAAEPSVSGYHLGEGCLQSGDSVDGLPHFIHNMCLTGSL